MSCIRASRRLVRRTFKRRHCLSVVSIILNNILSIRHILLGSRGIELPKISQKLETLSSRKTFEPLDPITDTDIQGFLKNEKENSILSVIGEVHRNVSIFKSTSIKLYCNYIALSQSFQTAQTKKWEYIMNDWKQEKVKLMNALIGKSENWIDIRKTPEQTILSESTTGGQSNLTSHEMAYARQVYEYNKLVLDGSLRPSLVQKFAAVALTFNDTVIIANYLCFAIYQIIPLPLAESYGNVEHP